MITEGTILEEFVDFENSWILLLDFYSLVAERALAHRCSDGIDQSYHQVDHLKTVEVERILKSKWTKKSAQIWAGF